MKKNKILIVGMLAFTLIFTLSVASCSGKTINTAEELKAYLNSQPANNSDKPIKVTIRINDQMLPEIATVLKDTDKYVSLNLSGKALTTIPNYAFKDCKTLVNITIPKIVTKIIETDVIADWSLPIESGIVEYFDLNMDETLKEEVNKKTGVNEKIVVKSSESSLDPRFCIYDDEYGNFMFYSLTNNSVIFVEKGQKVKKGETLARLVYFSEIGFGAFANCTSLTSVTIGNGFTSIGEGAFFGCTSLTNVTIPDSVTSIGKQAFTYCKSLTNLTIGKSVVRIGVMTFYECTNLTSITLGKSVKIINVSSNDCKNLTSIKVDINNPNYSSVDGILYDKAKTKIILVPRGITGNVTIPNGVTIIGEGALPGPTFIPNSFSFNEGQTFYGCASLTSITIPDSVTSIELMAFQGCTSLASVTIGNGVTSIGEQVFTYCESLTSIIIPNRVTSIGQYAFNGCTNLTSVTFLGKISGDSLYQDMFINLWREHLAGGPGTYTTTAPVNEKSKWTKQPESSNKSASVVKSSGKVSAFPGRWQLVEGRGDAKDMELFKDGTGTADGKGITWKIENGRFHLLHPNQTFSAYYNVTGSTITFTQDNGVVTKYQKK